MYDLVLSAPINPAQYTASRSPLRFTRKRNMSSLGGMELEPQQALDLLHKLITESTKVQAALVVPTIGARAFVSGTLRVSPSDNTVSVLERERDLKSPCIAFKPLDATVCRYGDERVLPPGVAGSFKRDFLSVMTFLFTDGSIIALFELAPGA